MKYRNRISDKSAIGVAAFTLHRNMPMLGVLILLLSSSIGANAQNNLINFIPKIGDGYSVSLGDISKQTFKDGRLVTSFRDDSGDVEYELLALSRVTFSSDIATHVATSEESNNAYTLYPIPVRGDLTLEFDASQKNSIQLSIYTLEGREVISNTYSTNLGRNQINISLPELKSGIYICCIRDEKQRFIQQLVKE